MRIFQNLAVCGRVVATLLFTQTVVLAQPATSLQVLDTRGGDSPPTYYNKELKAEFKETALLGTNGTGYYSGLLTIAPWSDNSGGLHYQIQFNQAGLFWRTANPESTMWANWNRLLTENTDVSINHVSVPFNWTLKERDFNRPIFSTGWTSPVGDYITIKHGGNNAEASTYGMRLSDSRGFEIGYNDFAVTLLRMDNGGYFGLGTTSPGARFTVALPGYTGTPTHSSLSFFSHSSNPSGSDLKPALEVSNNGGSGVGIVSIASNNYFSGKIGIGTTAPGSFKLAVEGKIGASEVVVSLDRPWPDYVFEDNYNLPSLSDLEQYINANKHLPEVPTAEEVKENGLSVGEMNAILLRKIEELTLYAIEQRREINELKRELNSPDFSGKKLEELTLHLISINNDNQELKEQVAELKSEMNQLKKDHKR